MLYRPEIDGLRAVAVTSVLLFHFFPTLFPLGYLGVDVFFVISGFLISSYIIKEFESGSFSFATFYNRRVRRILPVVMVVLSACTVVSYFVFLPSNLRDYALSLISSITFTSNIYFWRNGGYFGLDNSIEPLLHMWSLGVEEQYYLFFPIFIVLVLKYLKSKVGVSVLVFGIVFLSFLLNEYLVSKDLNVAAFFLLPTRAWQFGLGVLSAMYFMNKNSEHNKFFEIVVLCFLFYFLFTDFSYFHSGSVVSIVTAFFLASRLNVAGYARFFFLNNAVRKVGLISFSLYLWHWPLVAYLNYYMVPNYANLVMGLGLVLTFVLSLISYRFIEEPFRRDASNKSVYAFVISISLILSTFGMLVYQGKVKSDSSSDLAVSLSDARRSHYFCPIGEYFSYRGVRACNINESNQHDPSIAVLGNSHAQMYVPSLNRIFGKNNLSGVLIPLNGCLPTIDNNISESCLQLANANYRVVQESESIKTVIIGTTWEDGRVGSLSESDNSENSPIIIASSLVSLIEKFEAVGKKVLLVGPILTPNFDVTSELSRQIHFKHISREQGISMLKQPKKLFDEKFGTAISLIQSKIGSRLLMPSKYLCDPDYCYFGNEMEVYFSDSTHLSVRGVELMDDMFDKALINASADVL